MYLFVYYYVLWLLCKYVHTYMQVFFMCVCMGYVCMSVNHGYMLLATEGEGLRVL